MEHRNLKFIETVTSERTAETKKTKEVYLATNRKNVVGGRQISGETSLPSLVDVSLCTSDQVAEYKVMNKFQTTCIHAGTWWSSWSTRDATLVFERFSNTLCHTTRDIPFTSIGTAITIP